MVDVSADPPLFGPALSIGGEAGHCQIQVFQLLLHTSPSTALSAQHDVQDLAYLPTLMLKGS